MPKLWVTLLIALIVTSSVAPCGFEARCNGQINAHACCGLSAVISAPCCDRVHEPTAATPQEGSKALVTASDADCEACRTAAREEANYLDAA